jgi:glycosyltransferase involved in cell wall biosynthesis
MAEVSRYAIIGKYLGMTEHFDIIHAHDWMTFLAGVEAKLKSSKPLVVHVHATEFDRTGDNVNQNIYDIERYGMHMADKVIAVSHRTKQTIVERYGVDPSKVEVVHNAILKEQSVCKDQIQKNLNEKIVLFLGRITMQKGPEYFIEAARVVLNKINNVRFVMAGSGDLLPRMIERMAELKLLEHFHFTGFLDGERRERMYAMSDLFVMPSVSEPFGLTPIEAMLYNVPVIVSKQSGVSEVLENAIKVDFWDVQKLADSMIDVLTNTETARKAIEGISTELKAINWDDAAWKVISTYKQLT